ncbi:histidine phosphatase family protein [Jeotgalibacillus aurantiacus]|uniref:histidine phosphatase family protein n=1 Tax=Jeotgalibacillus aurantiacus TaxID=2763266 RepID=UPI001D0A9775|nr:histidine phosphatase family protein [Jeotgalibacillus aurantiacus]
MRNLYLIRHCQAVGQEPEAELTAKGKVQAKQLADFFEQIELERVISSPFVRAVETAQPIAQLKKLDVEQDIRLSERVLSKVDLPDWLDRLKESFADPDLKMPGGESASEAMSRGWEVVCELTEARGEAALVTHGNLLSLMLKQIDPQTGFEEWRALTNPDVYKVSYQNDSWTFSRVWTE